MNPRIWFPTALRDLLLRKRLTPSQLALLVGLNTETVESWLAGQLPKASSETVRQENLSHNQTKRGPIKP